MVSEYLDRTRSLEELDALFARDREVAAKIAASLFRHEVTAAIANIGEIHQVANARILADSQVASAKMLTDAEVTAATLMARAEIAAREILHASAGAARDKEVHRAMVAELCRNTTQTITNDARDSVEEIHRQANEAIAQLQVNAARAIDEIRTLADGITAKVAAGAEIARATLEAEQALPRSPEDVAKNAEAAAKMALDVSVRWTQQLRDVSERAIAELNAIIANAAETLAGAVTKAERRVLAARDMALQRVDEILAMSASNLN